MIAYNLERLTAVSPKLEQIQTYPQEDTRVLSKGTGGVAHALMVKIALVL